jgi:hypothetical protein
VGIRAWTNDLPGFTGIIKQRCAVPACEDPAMQRITTCTFEGPTTHILDASDTARLRYSDFRVNEVTVHGEVVRLTDLRPISGRREAREAVPAAAGAAVGAAEADPHAGAPQHPSAVLAYMLTTVGDRLPAMCSSRACGRRSMHSVAGV